MNDEKLIEYLLSIVRTLRAKEGCVVEYKTSENYDSILRNEAVYLDCHFRIFVPKTDTNVKSTR